MLHRIKKFDSNLDYFDEDTAVRVDRVLTKIRKVLKEKLREIGSDRGCFFDWSKEGRFIWNTINDTASFKDLLLDAAPLIGTNYWPHFEGLPVYTPKIRSPLERMLTKRNSSLVKEGGGWHEKKMLLNS